MDRLVFISILVVASVSIMVVTHMVALRVHAQAPSSTHIPFTFDNVDGHRRSDTVEEFVHPTGKRDAYEQKHAAERNVSDVYAVSSPKIHPNGSVFEVTVPISGQLGNQIFQYASLLGVAEMNGMKPFYGTSSKLRNIFQVTHLADRPHANFKAMFEKDFAAFEPSFQNLPRENVTIMQYLQSWKYFDFIRSTIQRELTFKQSVKDSAASLLQRYSAKIGNKTRVGIHVRRGDFLVAHHIRKGYHTAPASYVRKAMDHMRKKHGDVIFIFVTDDPGWCSREFKTPDHIIADKAPAEVHMAVLASCDHVIMTVGTYGWWGAYLAGGDVVYYWDRAQCLHDPPLPVEIKKTQDFFLPSWVPLTG